MMDYRALLLAVCGSLALSACGPQRTAGTAFQSAKNECLQEIIPQHFIVRYRDGRTETVRAPSKEEFISGFLQEHLNDIDYAEHDFRVVGFSPSQLSASQTGFADNWGARRINVDSLWQQGIRGKDIVVAVVDTGMDVEHVQLRNQVYSNPLEQGLDHMGRDRASNGIDDDSNGFVDDAFGFDFVANRALRSDYSYHGTHVAGIIAAEHADNQARVANYVQGIAPEAKVLPLAFLDQSGSGAISNAVRAIKYAVQRGAHVVNASWGGSDCSVSLRDTIAALAQHQVVFVGAAGNEALNVERTPMYPAAFNLGTQITVGAIGPLGNMASYSNFGSSFVHLFAPGTDIVSTYPGNAMVSLSGTSMAAPFVSGAVALMLSSEPGATVNHIRQALYRSALKNPDFLNASGGTLSMGSALAELRTIMTPAH